MYQWVFGVLGELDDAFRNFVMGGAYSRRRRQRVAVPDVRDLPFDEGWQELVLSGFDVTITRLEPRPAPVMGVIVDQSPPPGTVVRRSARVHISVMHPRDPRATERPRLRLVSEERVQVPDVRGVSFAEAWDRLIRAGLLVRLDRSHGDPRPVVGTVSGQEPPPATSIRRGAYVRLTVETVD